MYIWNLFAFSILFFSAQVAQAKAQDCETLDHVIISVNGERVKAQTTTVLELVKGDLLTVFEGWCVGKEQPVKVEQLDLVGFAPKRARLNKQDDTNYVIDTARDLQGKYAKDPLKTEFDLIARNSKVVVGTIRIKLIEPRLDRVELSVNGNLRHLKSGDSLELSSKDQIAVKRIVTNVRGNDNIKYELVSVESNPKGSQKKELVFSRGGADIGRILITWVEK